MPRETVDIPLGPSAPGTSRMVRMVRYGARDARPKAYLHAALHADETPAMLVAHHLLRRLDEADARGEIMGQVVVVPCANPIGLAQYVNGDQLGRYDLASGSNFNRGWPDLFTPVSDRIKGSLGSDGETNAVLVRRAMRETLEAATPGGELGALRVALAREACDADLVLDLHCDDEGLMHVFLLAEHWPDAADLAHELDCRAVLLMGASGGSTFSESMALPWTRLAQAFPKHPLPRGCLAATLELRGFADVSDELADRDAAGLIRLLQRRGQLAGEPGPLPAPPRTATAFGACDLARAAIAGVLTYRVELGQEVRRGDMVAEVVDPFASGSDAARRPVHAATDGFVLSRRLRRYVRAGDVVAKIAGERELTHREGYLLED